ncbi:hypothetical protein [Bacillus chungangensis]|uniref:50S ribosomal protein L33 n=1 Tax=Bacillus chungangensis TaxID=587633 RepID=A0ABT9WMC0_9BACI|nr:hypothetical protein [Bacillus chungangensis]MDQ0174401.1 hypothetical protein [Bacillus chungangensis]
MSEIYVIVCKETGKEAQTFSLNEPRKLLVYTSHGRARAAMKVRKMPETHYEIKAYVPKKEALT